MERIMVVKGSCHCSRVHFTLESPYPYPFNLCYCSVCRKTAGGGGYAINLAGDYTSMQIEGIEHVTVYNAFLRKSDSTKEKRSPAQRHFCRHCGSALWLWDPRWPDLVHPFASAIDSELPIPAERTHLMLGSKAAWVECCLGPHDKQFSEYPDESIAAWHQRLGLVSL